MTTTATENTLDAQAMLARAQAETGLYDWSDATLPQRFGLAVDQLNAATMDADGRRQAAQVCHWLLTSRLEFFEDRNRYPIADEVIERPMFVTGEPRTGTTLMHAMMSVDPEARALRFWEVMYPSPPPGPAGTDDPRRLRADDDWREINAKLPKWLHSHPYNDMLGDGLPEDERSKEPVFVENSKAWPIWADTTKMVALLGPNKVSVREGVRRTIEAAKDRLQTSHHVIGEPAKVWEGQ
jgi:Sulfotransferase family